MYVVRDGNTLYAKDKKKKKHWCIHNKYWQNVIIYIIQCRILYVLN